MICEKPEGDLGRISVAWECRNDEGTLKSNKGTAAVENPRTTSSAPGALPVCEVCEPDCTV